MIYEDFVKYAEEKGMTIGELTKIMGISWSAFYNYKRGKKIKSETKKALERFYETNIEKKENEVIISKEKFSKIILENETMLVEALNNGETIISASTGRKYKMVNGFLMCYTNNGMPLTINGGIDCTMTYYYLKPKPINLEVSKRYATKSGKVVYIFTYKEPIDNYLGVCDSCDDVYTYTPDGKSRDTNGEDLVYEV